jgi:hypothetical protein
VKPKTKKQTTMPKRKKGSKAKGKTQAVRQAAATGITKFKEAAEFVYKHRDKIKEAAELIAAVVGTASQILGKPGKPRRRKPKSQ